MGCRQGWFEGNVGMHEWVQGLQGTFQQAQSQERQAREEHTFQATEEIQQTLMGTHCHQGPAGCCLHKLVHALA
jgi:phage baseplate assembly protein W